jgi:thioredoxin reductase (NADPH)
MEYSTRAEVSIIGAGPIGIEMAVALKLAGVDYTHFDAQQIGYTISWWPRNTLFFSTTERIEISGVPAPTTTQQRLTGEEYLAYLRGVVEQFDLPIHTYERVERIETVEGGFTLHTRALSGPRLHFCRRLILATGDMHSPNRIGVRGEDLPHVSHYFTDPHRYFRRRMLIVGGRNSAAEAALRCWRAGAQVSLSYRRPHFDEKTVKHWILPDLLAQIESGNIDFYPGTLVSEIRPGEVDLVRCRPGTIEPSEDARRVQTDFVLLLTGFEADLSLFDQLGVEMDGPSRAPKLDPQTMETSVPGVYVAGTAAAGSQKKYVLFIENSHEHVGKIARAITGKWPERLGSVAARQVELKFEDYEAN